MCRWQRCDLISDCRHRVSNADPEDPLDRLSDLAADLFSPIPNRGQSPLPSIPDHPFGSDEKGVRSTFIPPISVAGCSYFGDRPWSPFKP